MNVVSAYVLRVGAFLIMAMVLENVLPETAPRRYIKFILSLLFVIVLIQPVLDWVRNGASLESITLELEEKKVAGEDYEDQAMRMVLAGYGEALVVEDMPPELRSRYRLMEIDFREDRIKVTVARQETGSFRRQGAFGSWQAEDLDFGSIGFSAAEESDLKESFAAYWGVSEERLEMRLQ